MSPSLACKVTWAAMSSGVPGAGQLIIRAIVAGERDPKALARYRNRRVKASAEEKLKQLGNTPR